MQRDEGELLGVPHNDLLGQTGEVDTDLGGDERELRHEVSCGGAVYRVGSRVGEAEIVGHLLRVKPQ